MSFAKKIAIGINLGEPLKEIFKALKELDFINHSEIHFVSINQTQIYMIGFGESAIIYPLEDDQKKIKAATLAELRELSKDILPKEFKGKVFHECLFADDPRARFCDYIEEKGIDTVIMAAREHKGFFESSFTQYISKKSKANVVILKHAL